LQAAAMRLQLAFPEHGLISPELYNQLMTMHGTVMMFFFAVPVMEGFAIYVVPLMLGTRDMSFPRLNAFGYYVYLIAGITIFTFFFRRTGARHGMVQLRAARPEGLHSAPGWRCVRDR
jgi:cytochrome c oxidase subunit I+III